MDKLRKEFFDHLNYMVEMRGKAKTEYSCIEEFVLKHGREYEISPLIFPRNRGKKKECFKNATLLSFKRGWTYVEGYAFGIAMPMLHGWCVNEDGIVVDPTWDNGKMYFGVEFSMSYVEAVILQKKTYGVLDNWEMGFPLLTAKHPYPMKGVLVNQMG